MIGTYVELRDQALRVENALRQVLERQEVWHCNRVWEAWAVDTMSRDDFSLVTEDPVAIEELVQAVMSVSQPATVPDAATEEAFKKAVAFDKAVALSERRQTLLEEAEAERDAALARIAEAAKLHRDAGESPGYLGLRYTTIEHCCGTCGSFGEYGVEYPCPTIAALDGAPEPEREREYRRVRPDGVPVFNAVFETMPLLDDYYTAEYRTVSPWLPVEGESNANH